MATNYGIGRLSVSVVPGVPAPGMSAPIQYPIEYLADQPMAAEPDPNWPVRFEAMCDSCGWEIYQMCSPGTPPWPTAWLHSGRRSVHCLHRGSAWEPDIDRFATPRQYMINELELP